MVLVPREPLLDIAEQSARVIHSQLLIFGNHLECAPRCKLWTDGARMVLVSDKYHLKLHHTHSKPINVRLEVDEANLFCVCLRASAVAGHSDQVHRLASIINSTMRAAHGHGMGGVGGGSGSGAVSSHPVQSPHANAGSSAPVRQPSLSSHPSGRMSPSPSAPPLVSAAAAASMVAGADGNGASTSGAPGRGGSGVYNVPGVEPSAPSTLPHRDSSAAADEELAARLQQSELMQARMTDSDLQVRL